MKPIRLALNCLFLILASATAAADDLRESIAQDYESRLSPLFVHFHQNPELPNYEF